jgi:hypothetical protein
MLFLTGYVFSNVIVIFFKCTKNQMERNQVTEIPFFIFLLNSSAYSTLPCVIETRLMNAERIIVLNLYIPIKSENYESILPAVNPPCSEPFVFLQNGKATAQFCVHPG